MTLSLLAALVLSTPALAFCEEPSTTDPERDPDELCHPEITVDALDFLRPELLDTLYEHVNDPDYKELSIPWTDIELDTDYMSDEHFDTCNFDGGVDLINTRYTSTSTVTTGAPYGVVPLLSPEVGSGHYGPDVHAAMERFAHLLHGAQDFYAHSNWVELGVFELVDDGTGEWTDFQVDAWDEPFTHDIVATQWEDPEDGEIVALDDDGRVLAVELEDESYRLLVSGVPGFNPGQSCPDGTLSHDELNKDNSSRDYYEDAMGLAWAQTRHEWCRMLHLTADDGGVSAVAVPLALLVAEGADPHPSGSECSADSGGEIPVTVRVSRLYVHEDHDSSGPGELNLTLVAFTDDLTRSVRSHTDMVSADSGDWIDAGDLPGSVELCVDTSQGLVVSVQGWDDDDGPSDQLDDGDAVLEGATFGPYDVDDLAALGSVRLRADSDHGDDLTVWIEISADPTGGCVSVGKELGAVDDGILGGGGRSIGDWSDVGSLLEEDDGLESSGSVSSGSSSSRR